MSPLRGLFLPRGRVQGSGRDARRSSKTIPQRRVIQENLAGVRICLTKEKVLYTLNRVNFIEKDLRCRTHTKDRRGSESEPGALPARHLEDSGRQGLRPGDGHRKRAGRRQGGGFGGGQGVEKRGPGGPPALRAGFPDIQGRAPRPGNLQPVSIMQTFLEDVLGVESESALLDACLLEHYVSKGHRPPDRPHSILRKEDRKGSWNSSGTSIGSAKPKIPAGSVISTATLFSPRMS